MKKKKLVQFGAGNIGRSFIGQLFGRAGYEVVFVDVAPDLVAALNEAGRYRVIVKQSGAADQILWVAGVRAVNGREPARVAAELADADLACTAVGAGALRHIWPVLAQGLTARAAARAKPLDIIFAENERDVAAQARAALQAALGPDFPLDQAAGLVESSIGKMVPIMRADDLAEDPLWVFGEPYNTLILDRRGFRNGVPSVPGIKAVDNIRAYVDRKLFVHNLGHAAAAYLGQQAAAGLTFIWEAVGRPDVRAAAAAAMGQAAAALLAAYPEAFTENALAEHIEDLLSRFANRALGDTIFRVGRDLPRKLRRDDRLVGAMRLAAAHDLPFDRIAEVFRAALEFSAGDEQGQPDPRDVDLRQAVAAQGLAALLSTTCGLDPAQPADQQVHAALTQPVPATI